MVEPQIVHLDRRTSARTGALAANMGRRTRRLEAGPEDTCRLVGDSDQLTSGSIRTNVEYSDSPAGEGTRGDRMLAKGVPVTSPTLADQVSKLYELVAGYHATHLLEIARELGVWDALAK